MHQDRLAGPRVHQVGFIAFSVRNMLQCGVLYTKQLQLFSTLSTTRLLYCLAALHVALWLSKKPWHSRPGASANTLHVTESSFWSVSGEPGAPGPAGGPQGAPGVQQKTEFTVGLVG